MYQLSDELALVPEWLHAMDRNNSMKHVDSLGHANQCVFISDFSSFHPQLISLKTMSTYFLEQKINHLPPFHVVMRMNGVQITG